VLVLLPPSEGKQSASDPFAPALDLARLAIDSPALTKTRKRVVDATVRLAEGRPNRAREILGLSPRQDAELERDRALWTAPTAPAAQIYTGVVYEALGYASLSPAAQRRADELVVVVSAMFGALRLTDPIPAYRLSGDVSLPRLGPLSRVWRKPLTAALHQLAEERDDVVLDLRSGPYAALAPASGPWAEQVLVGRVLVRQPDGSAQVVSHHNKSTKGRIVNALARRRSLPGTREQLLDAMRDLGVDVTVTPGKPGAADVVDLVVDEL
jgi:cytoplasmic iron level regulating protein YaaA (DUF328/UPF0246 family)